MAYFKWLTRPSSVARDEPYVRYLLNVGLKEFIAVPIDENVADYYVEKESHQQVLNHLHKQILKDWKKHLQEYPQKKENLLNSAKELKDAVKNNVTGVTLYVLYEQVVKDLFGICPYIFMPFALSEFVEEKVMQEYPEDFAVITSLSKPTAFHLFQKALLIDW